MLNTCSPNTNVSDTFSAKRVKSDDKNCVFVLLYAGPVSTGVSDRSGVQLPVP